MGNRLETLTKPIIYQSQHQLMTPRQFYCLCQQLSQKNSIKRLYFLVSLPKTIQFHQVNMVQGLLIFFDRLAKYLRKKDEKESKMIFYLQYVLIMNNSQVVKKAILRKGKFIKQKHPKNSLIQLSFTIAGEGLIGRVARVIINGEDFAFKAFFYPDFVWQHGPWAEIPVGIYLTAHQVTKDLPEFKFSGQDWAVWEWIDFQSNPQFRQGITYEQFAQQEGLTRLNILNRSNYNPHQIRLDLGGIQKEYLGRRFHDFMRTICFYFRKVNQEGILSLLLHVNWKNIRYAWLRLINLLRIKPFIIHNS
jgi:hypothetical protein